ncbi:hypothetical protein MFIFM68171_08423 [Madurella fahalii]|uniref:Uncharacterized protein n=1 Tax=Madurella fahalii TaxID=1157608 RepID=A0ABQ0GKD3_9PEZI
MATATIPGSYPLDDSLPPTPDGVMQQPVQPAKTTESQQHRQRNKLHKPNDPRGHRHTDSGVGLTDPESIQSSGPDEFARNSPEEIVSGGSYSQDHNEPSYAINSASNSSTLPQNAEGDTQAAMNRESEETFSAVEGTTEPNRPDNVKTTSQDQQTARNSTPYWGDLPKGGGGGVYNSVAGHGSASDDHAEHHHLPERSAASERVHIASPVGDYPRGGIYNTVTGHGSQDEESRRHSQPRSSDYWGISTGPGPTDGLYAAPLSDVPEEKQNPFALSDSRFGQPEIAPGFVPETAVRDDVMLAEAASSRKPEAASQRAFPLAAHHTNKPDDTGRAGSGAQYGTLAGAAGLGTAVAASELTDKTQNKAAGTSPVAQDTRRSRATSADEDRRIAGGTLSRKHRDETQKTSPVKKARSHEDTPNKGEKKHKIFGIFHRHKDDSSKENSSTHEQRRNSTGDHTKPVKHDAATNGVAAVSTPNRLRKQSKSEGAREHKNLNAPERVKDNAEDRFGNGKKAVTGAAAGVGAFGLHHKNNNNEATDNIQGTANSDVRAGPAGEAPLQVEEVSTPFEHPREPPMPPLYGTDNGAPGGHNALASDSPSVNQNIVRNKAGDDVVAREPGDYNVLLSSSAPFAARPFDKAHEPDVIAREPGDYTVRCSSKPGLVNPSPNKRAGITAQESGAYNISGSGVSSGFERDMPAPAPGAEEDGAAQDPTARSKDSDNVEYNCLSSGTPSGVKVKAKEPRSRHSTAESVHAQDQSGHNQYNTLASGTVSGIGQESRSTAARDFTARADDLKDLPIPSATRQQPTDSNISSDNGLHGASAASHGMTIRPNESQESVPGVTTYPHPEMVHNMSPEVMPDAYTASAPRHSSPRETTGAQHMSPKVMPAAYTASASRHVSPQTQEERDNMMHNMSPEVMPSAYRASAPRSQPTNNEQPLSLPPLRDIGQNNIFPAQKNRAANPALAAATASWGVSSAGQGQWNGAGKVMHKCQHCGRDNDISGYFA